MAFSSPHNLTQPDLRSPLDLALGVSIPGRTGPALSMAVARHIAKRLCDRGWIPGERHYDGELYADLAREIVRAAEEVA